MARVKISEYRAKALLLGDAYRGVSITRDQAIRRIFGPLVCKVDQGVKQRFKKGLVALDISYSQVNELKRRWGRKGYSRFLIEPHIPHSKKQERYLSLERVREGIRALYSSEGGIDIESNTRKIIRGVIKGEKDAHAFSKKTKIPTTFLSHVISVFDAHHFVFLELNPLLIKAGRVHLLDAAALVDDTAPIHSGWSEADLALPLTVHKAERAVLSLSKTTGASLKLKVLNPNGSLFFLLSGGGGSITIADEAANKGVGSLVGNYGEYSGGPTREETYLYTKEVLSLLLASNAKKKALVIAGGIANFTDVKETFAGIIDALDETSHMLRKQKVKLFVRRGGPNERAGLTALKEYLTQAKLEGNVKGSESPLTSAVDEAIRFVRT